MHLLFGFNNFMQSTVCRCVCVSVCVGSHNYTQIYLGAPCGLAFSTAPEQKADSC